jgi:hypothetical protein
MELVIGIACWYGIGYAGALLAARSLTGKPLDSFDYNFALVFGVFGLMIVPIATRRQPMIVIIP